MLLRDDGQVVLVVFFICMHWPERRRHEKSLRVSGDLGKMYLYASLEGLSNA